jgi:hypothetical protein
MMKPGVWGAAASATRSWVQFLGGFLGYQKFSIFTSASVKPTDHCLDFYSVEFLPFISSLSNSWGNGDSFLHFTVYQYLPFNAQVYTKGYHRYYLSIFTTIKAFLYLFAHEMCNELAPSG